MPSSVLEVRHLRKQYKAGSKKAAGNATLALDDVSFLVEAGEFVGIMGPSGSGKSTLLNCISTIDNPTSGSIVLGGKDAGSMNAKQLAEFRRCELGFVFQDSNLLDTLTGFENIALALTIQKVPAREIPSRVKGVADQLSVADVLQKYPYQMSGGQQQRIAAARAVVGRPHLVLADEPTGSLDSKSALQLLDSFEFLNNLGTTILMVTHDATTASFCHRIVFIKDGGIWGQIRRQDKGRREFFEEIVSVTTQLGGIDDVQ